MRSVFLFVFAAAHYFCVAQAVDQRHEISIGGIRQAIWVKGTDAHKPLLLFLHGGPGNSVMSYADKFCDQLYEHFTVIQWDQRDVGATLNLNRSPIPLTLSVMQRDAELMLDSLLIRFGRSKMYVVGHSWGTALGFHLVRTRAAQIEAFVAIGSMVNQQQSERIALELMKASAVTSNNLSKHKELMTVEIPFRDGQQLYIHRKSLLEYTRSRARLTREHVEQWSEKWLSLFNEASKENLFETLPEVHCPVYIFAGRHDYQTNSVLAEQYFKSLKAPSKGFYWFEKAGHSIPSTFGAKMQDIIIKQILNPPTGL
ncbi:MAG TPA: alpha/beta hydrolase [Chryseosolibacter sp.]